MTALSRTQVKHHCNDHFFWGEGQHTQRAPAPITKAPALTTLVMSRRLNRVDVSAVAVAQSHTVRPSVSCHLPAARPRLFCMSALSERPSRPGIFKRMQSNNTARCARGTCHSRQSRGSGVVATRPLYLCYPCHAHFGHRPTVLPCTAGVDCDRDVQLSASYTSGPRRLKKRKCVFNQIHSPQARLGFDHPRSFLPFVLLRYMWYI